MSIQKKENQNIIALKNDLEELLEKRSEMMYDLSILNKYIENLKKQIYSSCNHTWVIDYTSVNERTEYYCSVCGFEK